MVQDLSWSKVEASLADHVHLTIYYDHVFVDMDEIYKFLGIW